MEDADQTKIRGVETSLVEVPTEVHFHGTIDAVVGV